MKHLWKSWLALLLMVVAIGAQADTLLKPFVLASRSAGTAAEKANEVKRALEAAGFAVVGDYAPYAGAQIIVVTNDELKRNAAASEFGGYGAVQRVAVTEAGGAVQVSYTNPVYMSHVYRMKGDLSGVAAALGQALGRVEAFGAQGMSAKQARKYHYTLGMEYFDEPSVLASYASYDEAVRAVDARLSGNKNGIGKVYRVDVPGKQETVFGVGMKGSNSFMNIMKTPEAIRTALQSAVQP